ncbi:MAG: hypothetical protein SGJ18_15410 [Pseudomonadota bacterium]|nr:hypothetical protein [Pseudomonadota bacterium]
MKKLVLIIGMLFPALGWSATAYDVCDNVNKQVPSKGAECHQIINQAKSIDNTAIEPCHIISFRDPISAVQCISAMINNIYDLGAVRTCVVVARRNPTDVPACMIAAANKTYTPEAAYACQRDATNDTKAGISCLETRGTPNNKGTCPPIQEIRDSVKTGIDLIKNKTDDKALVELELLLEKLASCS